MFGLHFPSIIFDRGREGKRERERGRERGGWETETERAMEGGGRPGDGETNDAGEVEAK
jgi:hypothetical protein